MIFRAVGSFMILRSCRREFSFLLALGYAKAIGSSNLEVDGQPGIHSDVMTHFLVSPSFIHVHKSAAKIFNLLQLNWLTHV